MENRLIKEASFNPKVRTYIFIITIFYLIISIIGILILPIWILGLGQWISKKFFLSLKCKLNEKNLSFSKGIILHVEKTIPLENIQDLSFIGGPILRSFGLTLIKIETAGGGGAHQANMMSMIGIEKAEEYKDLILSQRDKLMNGKQTINQFEKSSNEIEILQEIRDELKSIKQVLKEK